MKRCCELVVMASALLVFAGCQSGKSPNVEGGSKALTVAFVTNNSADFWTIARRGVEKADAELDDVTAEFRITADGQAGEQKRIIDDLLTKGVGAIAISPIDPENQTALINDAAKKAIIFTQDSDAPKSNRTCYIGTDNLAAGRQAGQLIREAVPNGGKIMLFVGKLDARNAQERTQGIKEVLAGTKVEIIDVRTDETDRVRAQKNVEDTLVKYPDVTALVGLWSYNGPAIVNAVRGANKVGAVKIICFDEEDDTLAGVADGAIFGTVVQQPYEFGRQAITRMAKHLAGDKDALAGGKQIVPTFAIKHDNVAEFSARLKKLLGK